MNARDEILAAARGALAQARSEESEVPGVHRKPVKLPDLVGLFVERVADYGVVVRRCAESEVAGAIAEALADARTVAVPDGFPHPVTGPAPSGPRTADAVVTTVAIGIAETGTVVLDHGPGQGPRVFSLLPDIHVCVVRGDQIVPGVPAAIAGLDPLRAQTWISGPSATSDIELDRVEGVHGPRSLRVVVVDA
ncbi:L-lactate dehydrogenase complex protein LldG [Lentzea fradiae]|uniref:L-lactate dehydrogenase complex protein LldG n=1 Tax=Lentzea fradiae TaxID=200378 RepID=A0A1G7WEY6_9PSEU|nr:LUD domain-containing protein [Lentzea fradiae]SDG70319.1 L-lactate dehydrogenase complex protein LldG [Lentzea fradiae]